MRQVSVNAGFFQIIQNCARPIMRQPRNLASFLLAANGVSRGTELMLVSLSTSGAW